MQDKPNRDSATIPSSGQMLIDGRWVGSASGATLEVENPR